MRRPGMGRCRSVLLDTDFRLIRSVVKWHIRQSEAFAMALYAAAGERPPTYWQQPKR